MGGKERGTDDRESQTCETARGLAVNVNSGSCYS